MITFIRNIWLSIKLFFAKRHISFDMSNTIDKTAWVEFRKVNGIIYITKQGFWDPPSEDKKESQ